MYTFRQHPLIIIKKKETQNLIKRSNRLKYNEKGLQYYQKKLAILRTEKERDIKRSKTETQNIRHSSR